jgi:GrpB-like predicted nucleotidyltransferase (UPF0157 family)
MKIVIVPYDPLWVPAFETASGEIAAALQDNLDEIHHIGSTAIPGMPAKPIIDMLAVVADLTALDQNAAEMQSLGYEVMGEFGIAGRRYFRRDNALGQRTHHVHAFPSGSPHIHRHLAFRDFLRAHPALAEQYVAVKRRSAEAHPNDMNADNEGKDSFVKEIEKRALAWAAANRS